jgi:hypothetical protein
MSGNVTLNGTAITHANAEFRITPQFGKNAGQFKRLLTVKSCDANNGQKHVVIEGPQPGPVQIGVGKAEPSWKLALTHAEALDLFIFIGQGYLVMPLHMLVSYQMPKQKVRRMKVKNMMIEGDPMKQAVGEANMVDLEGKCLMVEHDGINPFKFPV